jgi:hypothetical protein
VIARVYFRRRQGGAVAPIGHAPMGAEKIGHYLALEAARGVAEPGVYCATIDRSDGTTKVTIARCAEASQTVAFVRLTPGANGPQVEQVWVDSGDAQQTARLDAAVLASAAHAALGEPLLEPTSILLSL